MREKATGSLVRHVRRTSLVALAMILVALLATVVGGGLLLRSHERMVDATSATREARRAHAAMLDQQTGVRGFLLTGERRYLDPYAQGADVFASAEAVIAPLISGDAELVELFVNGRVAAERWVAHAAPIAEQGGSVTADARTAFVDADKALFDEYRSSDAVFVTALAERRDAAATTQRELLAVGFVVQLLLLVGVWSTLHIHRRRLDRRVIRPVRELQDVIGRLTGGDLGARVPTGGYEELDAAGDGLAVLADSLVNEQMRAQLRADLLASKADSFRELLRTSREINGNLNLRYVTEAIETSARRLTGWPHTRVHLVGDDEPAVPGGLADVVSTALPSVGAGTAAFPMVVGGAVVGVLSCIADDAAATVGEDLVEVLAVLAGQAASSVEAARLHSRLAAESRIDALTALPNRRSLDEDLAQELERSRRYDRPLSLLMIDLDHFKVVNDQHGHATGDAVLRAVGQQIASSLRTTDTAYRYGGEELTVLLRETELSAAVEVAERLGATIERRGGAGVDVTASIGAVELGPGETVSDLLSTADDALYRAKREGRNRVVAAADDGVVVPMPAWAGGTARP